LECAFGNIQGNPLNGIFLYVTCPPCRKKRAVAAGEKKHRKTPGKGCKCVDGRFHLSLASGKEFIN
jgi:hypothetical protein